MTARYSWSTAIEANPFQSEGKAGSVLKGMREVSEQVGVLYDLE